MKKIISTIAVGMFLLSQVGTVGAASFGATVTVPAATSATVTMFKVTCNNAACTTTTQDTTPSTTMDFSPLAFNTTNSIYTSDHFYQINVVPSGAFSSMTTNVSYTEGTIPVGQAATNGLGAHASAAFLRVDPSITTGTSEFAIAPTASTKLSLKAIGTAGTSSTLTTAGNYMKVYVGLETGGTQTPAKATDTNPFSAADKVGTYTGTLVVTATVS